MRAFGRMRKEPRGSFFYGRGFSLAELVAILVIVSILSAVAVTSVSGGFASQRGFYDDLRAQVRWARKVAIAQRRSVFVRIGAAQSVLCYEAAGACTGVASPTGAVPFALPVPAGIGVTAATLEFDGLGRYPAAGPQTITVSGDGNLAFTVWNETGYVQ